MISEYDIIALEKKFWKAMENKDVETAVSLTHFPCLITSPEGTRPVKEDEFRKIMNAHPLDYKDVELLNPQVDKVNEETVFISYTTNVKGKKMQDVSTWIKEGQDWVCAYHSEIPIQ